MNQHEPRIIIESGEPRIRGLGVTVWEIYRKLSLVGMREEEILRQHPGLLHQDFLAVLEYIAAEMQSRTHDELTGRPTLPKNQLKHGSYYLGRCHNACIARWNAEDQLFYYWHCTSGSIYVKTIKYPMDELETLWDFFRVVKELSNPKFEIPFDTNAPFTGNLDDLAEYHLQMQNRD